MIITKTEVSEELVSVIIPTFKRSAYIFKTIDSVINQSYSNIEIIVVDDNGIGNPYQVETQKKIEPYIKKNQIKYIKHQANRNGSAARNSGLNVAHGSFIKFLDDDDELLPDCIKEQTLVLMNSTNEYGATYCSSKTLFRNGNKIHAETHTAEQSGDIHTDFLLGKCLFNTSALLFKRDCIYKLNGFDESYYRHQDLELMTRFFVNYKIVPTKGEPLIIFDMTKDRENVTNTTKDFEIKQKYLNQFEPLFVKWKIKNEVNHHFWFNCALNSLLNGDYQVMFSAFNQLGGIRHLKIKEYTLLVKFYFQKLLK